jgi:iron complex outermembrane receptor protein
MLRKQTDSLSESGTTEDVDLNDPTVEIPSSLTSGENFSRVDRYGLLLQDQMRWKSFHLLLGGRIDRHESDQDNEGTSYSPRVGLTWMLTERLALYGNYSHAEAPNFGYNGEDGKELTDSWKVNQYEAGIKANVFADLFATVACFKLKQENTPIAIEDLVRVYESEGKNESKGIEATVSGNITPEWSCRLSYTYIDYKNLDTDENYDRFPPNSLALWTAYRFLDGSLRGLQLGGGYRYAESYVTTFRGAYIGPEYVIGSHNVFDVIADYELPTALPGMEKTVVSFGIKNIFNEEYAESVRHAPQAFPGEPRTFLVSLRGNF